MKTADRSHSSARANSARVLSRKLALQALYRWQLNQCQWQELMLEFDQAEEAPRADREYFRALVETITRDIEAIDTLLDGWCDRKASELDPVEHAALMIGVQDLRAHPEVPFRVAISEATNLARRFGATDGHKFVNAVLDQAARELRPDQH
jgi:transcription antitermination protein NusB